MARPTHPFNACRDVEAGSSSGKRKRPPGRSNASAASRPSTKAQAALDEAESAREENSAAIDAKREVLEKRWQAEDARRENQNASWRPHSDMHARLNHGICGEAGAIAFGYPRER